MNLRDARLCLDCEELHTTEICPRCASEAFAFLAQWLPTEPVDDDARPLPAPRPPAPLTKRQDAEPRWR